MRASAGFHTWRVVPCLVLTFMFGPAGWLLYVLVRSAFGMFPPIVNASREAPAPSP